VSSYTKAPTAVAGVLSLFVCLLCVAFAASASAAPAGQSYGYQNDVGSGNAEPIFHPAVYNGVAVSSSDGRIFIPHQFDFGVQDGAFEVLNPDGTSLALVSTAGVSWPSGIAVSPDGSSVYLLSAQESPYTPVKYTSDGAPTPTYTLDPSWAPSTAGVGRFITGIGVDPVTGDVLLSGDVVQRFDSTTGALLSTIDGSTVGSTADVGWKPFRLAIAPNRDIYTIGVRGRLDRFGFDGSWKGRLGSPTPATAIEPHGIAVNPQNGDVAVSLPPVYVTGNDSVIRIFTSANDFKEDIRIPSAVAGGTGLAFSPDGTKLYAGQKNGTARVFELGTKPGLDGPTASQITPFGFRLTDMVGTGGESTNAHFEYCLALDACDSYLTAEGASPWHALPEHTGLANPSEDDEIFDDVTGLEPLRDYLVRSYAYNEASHVENISASVLVSTPPAPPEVQTGAATAENTTATLLGTVTGLGAQTTYHFEYGLTTSYGSRAPANVDAVAGAQRTPRAISQTVKGLQPGTTYHYRLVATNVAGTTAGSDLTFTTLGADQVAPGRAYEQVTSPDKNGLSVNANFGFQAAPGGGAIEYGARAPSGDGESGAQVARYVARRGATNWIGQQPLDPPQTAWPVILHSVTGAVSDDFNHSLSVSRVKLTPDATEGAVNIYVRDLRTGGYQLLGTATQTGAFSDFAGLKRQDWYIGGAPDFSWVVINSRYPLLPGAPQRAMYKWTEDGGLSLLSLLPGDTVPSGDIWIQSSELTANRLVSDDGDTAAFSLMSGETGVYLRSKGQTLPVSVSQASGGPAGVQPGIAVGMSRDGHFLVFLSNAKLTDDASLDTDLTNLYRFDTETGELEFLGLMGRSAYGDDSALVGQISNDGETIYFNRFTKVTDPETGEPANPITELVAWRDDQLDVVAPGLFLTETQSPNGRYLVYPDQGLHLYDAETGEQTCISCPPGGAGGAEELPDHERTISNRIPQAVTDDGHAFFSTYLPLVGADHNSALDVYEYFEGRLSLISPGSGNFTATLVDISPDGRDVFFTTSQGLVAQDTDRQYDVYDARIGGGLAAQNPPAAQPCAGDACQGTPSALPAVITPGSAQSKAGGNPKPGPKTRCGRNARKVERNGKARCVKKQRKHGDKKRDSKDDRGANR
jgi:WD40 repeat protein